MKKIAVILLGLLALAGCAPSASQEFAKIEPGMTRIQVAQALGQPEFITTVRFSGHTSDFEIWQYQLKPDVPLCPGDMVITTLTLGLSQLAREDLDPKPHWVYFQEGMLVYTSPAFDCTGGDLCKVTGKFTKPGL
jgi:hypothetical protein